MPSISVEHIEIDDRGIARIAGRRTQVTQIVLAKQVYGWSPDEIAEQYPHLSLAEIHAAFAFYYDHRAEIDDQMARELEEFDRLRAEAGESPVAERLRREGRLQ
jgi:uncharacterized protein (DUF433 family)